MGKICDKHVQCEEEGDQDRASPVPTRRDVVSSWWNFYLSGSIKAVFESPFAWSTEIRHERNIGDFTRWKNHDDYQKAFTRLLRDLKAEA